MTPDFRYLGKLYGCNVMLDVSDVEKGERDNVQRLANERLEYLNDCHNKFQEMKTAKEIESL